MKKSLALLELGLHLRAAAQSAAPAVLPADSVRYWATHLRASLNANEALISKKWKSGGTSSLGLSLLFNGTTHYQRGVHSWQGEADFLYADAHHQGKQHYQCEPGRHRALRLQSGPGFSIQPEPVAGCRFRPQPPRQPA